MPELRATLEAILMVVDEPLGHIALAEVVGVPPARVLQELRELAASYDDESRGFELRNVAGGWRYFSRERYADAVERFVLEGQQARLTAAALETLAVVAYRQPISRGRVSAIRGVDVDGVMRTLVARGLVEESGSEAGTGAVLFRTTGYFCERMGLASLEELPAIAPFLPDLDDLAAEDSEPFGLSREEQTAAS